MAIRSRENLFGAWAFLIGVILAVLVGILGFGSLNPIILSVLVLLGLIVGFINVSSDDQERFLLAAVSLVLVSFAGIQSISSLVNFTFVQAEIIGIEVGKIIVSILGALLMLLVPATIVVALKSLFSISSQR